MTAKKFHDFARNLVLLFIFFAVCGWIYEVVWVLFNNHMLVNRGFMFGPWLPIYGFGGLLIYAIFGRLIKKPVYIGKFNIRFILLFLYIFLAATAVELAATYIIELFGMSYTVLWDYSDNFLNFDGRVCFDASARFGILGLLIIYVALPLYEKLINMKNQKLLNAIAWTIIGIFAIDLVCRIPFGNNYVGPA